TEEQILGLVKEFKEASPDLFRTYFTLLLPILTEELAIRIIHDHASELFDRDLLRELEQTETRFAFLQAFEAIKSLDPPSSLHDPLIFLYMAKLAVTKINHPLIKYLLDQNHKKLQDKALFQEFASRLYCQSRPVEEMSWLLSTYPDDLNELGFIRAHFSQAQIDTYFYVDKISEYETFAEAPLNEIKDALEIHDALY